MIARSHGHKAEKGSILVSPESTVRRGDFVLRARRTGFTPYALTLAIVAIQAAGCSKDDEGDPAPTSGGTIFGGGAGMGGSSDRKGGTGGGAGGASAHDSGPEAAQLNPSCIGVPAETELRIDDFEDGNNAVRGAPGRQGFWIISHDDTPGMVVPDGTFVPSVGGANGTDYAAHFVASGFTDWGVNVLANMQRLVGGVHCPFSAVGTRGFGLWLKGKGRVRIGASTAGVYSIEFGGTCNPDTESCWDNHTKMVPLPTEWTYREILWGSLEQSGWGKKVPLDLGSLLDIRFALLPEDLPGEFWVDEITLLPNSDGGSEAGPLDAAPELDVAQEAAPDSADLGDAALDSADLGDAGATGD